VLGADIFIGLSGPNLLISDDLAMMNDDAIVFGLSNPVPEFDPVDTLDNVAIVAIGRSDYPNQIDNALVFPGFFKGLFEARAIQVTTQMKLNAAMAITDIISPSELSTDNILPKHLIPGP